MEHQASEISAASEAAREIANCFEELSKSLEAKTVSQAAIAEIWRLVQGFLGDLVPMVRPARDFELPVSTWARGKIRNYRRTIRALNRKLADFRYGVEHREELEQLGAYARKTADAKNWARAANEAHNETRAELRATKAKLQALVDALAREGTMGERTEDVRKAFETALTC